MFCFGTIFNPGPVGMHDGYKNGFFPKTPSLDCLEMHQNSSRVIFYVGKVCGWCFIKNHNRKMDFIAMKYLHYNRYEEQMIR